MKVQTDSERVRHSRKLVLELLASSVDLSTTAVAPGYLERYDAQPERFGPAGAARSRPRPQAHRAPRRARRPDGGDRARARQGRQRALRARLLEVHPLLQVRRRVRRAVPEHVRDPRRRPRLRRAHLDRVRRRAARVGVRLLRQLHRRLPDRRADVPLGARAARGGRMAGGRADGDDDGVPVLRRRLQPRAPRAGQHDRQGDEPRRPRRHARQPLHQGPLRLPARPGARRLAEMRAGAVVLAGGRSSRMGRPKALLDWHGQTAVEHAVAVVREGVGGGPVCVVRAPGQELPALDAIVVDDPVAYAGPLAALPRASRHSRARPRSRSPAASTRRCSCRRSCVRSCGALRDGDDAVVPVIGGRAQPLLAAYRVAARAAAPGAARPRRSADCRDIPGAARCGSSSEAELLADAELAAADPRLRSALNANTPEEWAALELVLNRHKRRDSSRRRTSCVESTQTLSAAGCLREDAGFSRRRVSTSPLSTRTRLAVVERDRETSVGGDRAGRAARGRRPGRGGRGARSAARAPPRARRARRSSQAA